MKLIFILTLTYIFVSSNNISANENIENCSIKNVPSKERIFSKNFSGVFNEKRIDYIVKCAKELLPQLKDHEDEWLGFRPTLPDFLPVIGPSKNYKNIVYAFGHQHLGWTLGAITGKVVSGILANEKTNLDLTPYSSSRFN